MKNKFVAAFLAFFLGVMGVHRFYLGQRFLGILYFFIFFAGIFISMQEHEPMPIIALPAILGFIDSILLAVMPQDDFDDKYNKKRKKAREQRYTEERQALPAAPSSVRHTAADYKKSGIEKFRDFAFEAAILDFQKALESFPNDAATHFNIACCYSILEQKEAALQHLDQAVAYGFKHFEKIQSHDALSFLRTQPEFDDFVKNDYRLAAPVKIITEKQETSPLPTSEEKPLILPDDLLDQIIQLGELRNKGVLTEEEFAAQKEKILAKR